MVEINKYINCTFLLLLSEALNIMDNLDALCEALKVAPKLYDDGLKPGVKATGKVLALIPEAINAACYIVWQGVY